jgi:hypothetical protein
MTTSLDFNTSYSPFFEEARAVGIVWAASPQFDSKLLVDYATAGMHLQIFVSKYLLQLPNKETLEHFIQHEIATWK